MMKMIAGLAGLICSTCLLAVQYRHAGSIKKVLPPNIDYDYWRDKIDSKDIMLLIIAAIFFLLFLVFITLA
jgi:hypothetical protein